MGPCTTISFGVHRSAQDCMLPPVRRPPLRSATTQAPAGGMAQGPHQESELMGSKPFWEIENCLILVAFSVKI